MEVNCAWRGEEREGVWSHLSREAEDALLEQQLLGKRSVVRELWKVR